MEIVDVKALDDFRLFLKFSDGISGVVDLSEIAGKGVFSAFLKNGFFQQVRISDQGAVEWPGELDLCPDSLYLKVTDKKPEELFPAISRQLAHA